MGDGPALRYQWDKVQWIALKDKPWTGPEIVELVLRVEELAEKKVATSDIRPKLRLVKE